MDNVNVIRVGFIAPEFRLTDTDGEIGSPIDKSGQKFTCLLFINPDDLGYSIMKDLDNGLPATAGGFKVAISPVIPLKPKLAKGFKSKLDLEIRLFCDSDLRAGRLFSVIDSGQARPAYHPTVFIIGEDGSVRYRQAIDPADTNGKQIRLAISRLI
jgi:peroxiredoxin